MGLLDDLRREADRVREEREAEETRQAELERIYRVAVAPRLIEIHRYLTELLDHLDTVCWTVDTTFSIPGIGRIEGLNQGNYSVHIDSHKTPKRVRLLCACLAGEERTFSVDVQKADELRQFLLANQAFFTEWPQRDGMGKIKSMMFQAKVRVRAELSFEADIRGSRILVASHNFEGVTDREYWFGYATIDENWLDGLGNYVLRKKLVLGGQEMSEEARDRLRRIVDREKAHRARNTDNSSGPDSAGKRAGGILGNLRTRLFRSDKSD